MKGRKIAVDIGNSRIKSGEFEGAVLLQTQLWENLEDLSNAYSGKGYQWAVSSVRNHRDLMGVFEGEATEIFTNSSPLPITIHYKTPETLGIDRILGVIGGRCIVSSGSLLVVDLGTCITYDLLTAKDEFLGGVIAPGLVMRLRSMHQFTEKLPDVSKDWQKFVVEGLGKSTQECLVKGAYDAILLEIDGFIREVKKDFPDLSVILTGGDTPSFESKIKEAIFADQNLILKGLNQLLESR